MHAGRRRNSEVRSSDERMYAVGDDVDLRLAPDVYGRQLPCMHLHFVDLHADGHGVPGRADARKLRGRRKQLPLPRVDLEVPDNTVVLGNGAERRVRADLFEQLRLGPSLVRVGQPGDVRPRE